MHTDPRLADEIETCRAEWDPQADGTTGFDALLDRWPDEPAAHLAVAMAHDEAGRTDSAIAHYERALEGLDGAELRRAFLRLGDALRTAGRLDESAAVLERGLDEFPGSRSLRTWLALTEHERGRTDAALGLVLAVLVDPMPSPDLELFAPDVRRAAATLLGRDG